MKQTPVLLIGVEFPEERNFTHAMTELRALAEAAGLEPAADITQKLERPVAATLFGSGKPRRIVRSFSLQKVRVR